MNKVVVISLISLCTVGTCADAIAEDANVVASQQGVKPKRSKAEIAMRRHGGTVMRRLPGKALLILDCRTSNASDFQEVIGRLEIASGLPFECKKGNLESGACPVDLAKRSRGENYAGVIVLTSGAADASTLTVLPEDCVSVLNVTPYYSDGTEKGDDRFYKELWRVVAYTCGGVNTFTPYCVMKTITKPSDLDKIQCKEFNPDVGDMVKRDLGKWGFGRIERQTYSAACRAGWAPAPTNEFQKAIWDKAQIERQFDKQAQAPTNPIIARRLRIGGRRGAAGCSWRSPGCGRFGPSSTGSGSRSRRGRRTGRRRSSSRSGFWLRM